MKKIFFFFFLCSISYSQWVQQLPGQPGYNSFLDVTFINQNTGWVCGEGGIIFKTTNSGINWIQQNSGTGNILEGIHAVDSQYVYCDGWWNTILKTTNGGINWMSIRNGTVTDGISFYGLYFLNRTTGWLLRNNYIVRTRDGGITFDSTNQVFTYLWDIYFKDSLNGVLCGDGSLIMKSTNGGSNWNQIQIPLSNSLPNFYKISFVNNFGWEVGNGNDYYLGALCWRTTNFGTSWDTISRLPVPSVSQWENYCIYFANANTGWCGGTYGYIFKTTNGGFNWYQQITPSIRFRNSFWFYNDNTGWAVGAQEEILKTTNGGEVGIKKISKEIPNDFKLYQNYPNPFNNETTIEFDIRKKDSYKLELFDILGRSIKILFNESKTPGKYKISFDAGILSSGMYFYKLYSLNHTETKKLILLK